MSQDQASTWNQADCAWVAMQEELDAQLEPLGRATIDALNPTPGERVLDVGCGAGATSLMLAKRIRPGAVVGVDVSAPLVARARERSAGLDNVSFELGDAQRFAFAPASFDALFSRFGVMFFDDPVAAFKNLRSALRPGGRLAFVCWRARKANPTFVLPLAAALPVLSDPPPPEPDGPGPFAFADREEVQSVLARAGFGAIAIAAHDSELVFGGGPDLDGAVELALRVGPLSRALAKQPDADRGRVREAVREAFARHHGPAGVTLPSATWIVTARRSE